MLHGDVDQVVIINGTCQNLQPRTSYQVVLTSEFKLTKFGEMCSSNDKQTKLLQCAATQNWNFDNAYKVQRLFKELSHKPRHHPFQATQVTSRGQGTLLAICSLACLEHSITRCANNARAHSNLHILQLVHSITTLKHCRCAHP